MEFVEIVLNGVTGTPGTGGEYVNHVTTTVHGEQIIKRYYDAGLNFMQTTTGKHVMIWQADESNPDGLPFGYHGHAIWHVTTPYSTIATQMNSLSVNAEVDLNQSDDKNVHYVFVPEADQEAVTTWRAKPLSYTTASGLASRVDNADVVRWPNTKRITYDFFVHSGVITSDQTYFEPGIWLPGAWYTAANGGFDGRWVQLFDDRAGVEPAGLLELSVSHPATRCGEAFDVIAKATGGLSPYTFTWVNATPVSPSYAPTNYATMTAGSGSVTVQSADGQIRTYSIRVPIKCTGTGGGVIP